MNNLSNALDHFAGKKILITGNTGFKGSWLSIWLNLLGAEVNPMFFNKIKLILLSSFFLSFFR